LDCWRSCVGKPYEFGKGAVGAQALTIASTKTGLGFGQALALGALCNALVCLAVWLCYSARTTADKILSIVPPIAAFVAAGLGACPESGIRASDRRHVARCRVLGRPDMPHIGTPCVLASHHVPRAIHRDHFPDRPLEHSVANMYFIPFGLFVKHDSAFVGSLSGVPDLSHLTWSSFVVHNLVPVTIGNVIGGGLMVGALYWLVYLRKPADRGAQVVPSEATRSSEAST
jgi:formate transporter